MRFVCLFALLTASATFAQPLVAPSDARSPENERRGFQLPPGFEAQLIVSEPDIQKPMQLAFDTRGRIWVTCSVEYPWAALGRSGKDKIVVLEDLGPDGKARKVTTFADDLNIPIGILPLPDGKTVLASSIDPGDKDTPAACWIWKLTDDNGDLKYDRKEKLYGPFGIRDTHGMVNSFTLMPDGWVYACHGFSNDSKPKGKDGHEITLNSGSTIRFRPDGHRIEVYSRGQVNPFGMTFDRHFNFYNADCHSRPMTQFLRGAVYESFGKPHDGLGYGPNMIAHDHSSTGLCGLAWYEATHFPKEYTGSMFLGNVVTSRINLDTIEFTGSSPKAVARPDFLISDDLWFRPVDVRLGPDGALYVNDFYNKIIGHYEVDLKHPGRDRTRGRMWRIVYKGAPKPLENYAAKKTDELDETLGSTNITARMLATHELIRRTLSGEQDNAVVADQIRNVPNSVTRAAHRLWVQEAIGHATAARNAVEDKAKIDAPDVDVHRIRIATARTEWDREHQPTSTTDREKSAWKNDPQTIRAWLDRATAVPNSAHLQRLLGLLPQIPAGDVQMRHAARIALRETLKLDATWATIRKKAPTEAEVTILADVLPGLPTPQAAEFLTGQLPVLSKDPGRLPGYIEHAARWSDNPSALLTFVQTHKADDLRTSVVLFDGYRKGLQQRAKSLSEAEKAYAVSIVGKGIGDADPGTVGRCFEIAGSLRLNPVLATISAFASRKDRGDAQRAQAFATLMAIDAAQGKAVCAKVLNDAEEPVVVRERAAQALGNSRSYPELLAAIEKAPARIQTAIASSMAGQADGAEQLLKAIAAGKASPRLLQDRGVEAKLRESKLPNLTARVGELTKGMPSADTRMINLMNQRRSQFASAKTDAKLGAESFKKNCANCHQLGGEGAKVGPQLDGVGIRGLDRLLEDILDPSRNVDQAFRATTLNLNDGRSLTGLILREEGAITVMADNLGKDIRIETKSIDEKKTSNLSPMPANFHEAVKEDEFLNLLAFLLNQRQEKK
jgi:putative heme-binding domain-containing protein